jgi:hypothetical protein
MLFTGLVWNTINMLKIENAKFLNVSDWYMLTVQFVEGPVDMKTYIS